MELSIDRFAEDIYQHLIYKRITSHFVIVMHVDMSMTHNKTPSFPIMCIFSS